MEYTGSKEGQIKNLVEKRTEAGDEDG